MQGEQSARLSAAPSAHLQKQGGVQKGQTQTAQDPKLPDAVQLEAARNRNAAFFSWKHRRSVAFAVISYRNLASVLETAEHSVCTERIINAGAAIGSSVTAQAQPRGGRHSLQ